MRRSPIRTAPAEKGEAVEKITQRLVSWASQLDDGAREQAIVSSTMPFIHPHIALMPDAHLGLGATVGSVIPTLGAVMPAAVGVDIGCGMIALHTQLTADDLPADKRPLRLDIERVVPASKGGINKRITHEHTQARVAQLEAQAERDDVDPDSYAGQWRMQLGSLGSGNHFIELCLDESDEVWIFLHSGSRGVGNKIAQHHIKVAQEWCRRAYVSLPHRDLAYLVEGTDEFWAYIRAMRWAQSFALLNREEMMDRVVACVARWLDREVEQRELVNTHHNYTEQETHFGRQVWVSRKGAISARAGETGLIPGSMGTASYVVRGLGNPVALHSSPHGAGRAHSRTRARQLFSQEQLREAMAGIEFRDSAALIDEIPAAYKPIDQVMADSRELVEVRHTLRQVVNVKGD
nr:RtcB family protein [Arsenicicoccus dermatophilus]